MVLETDQARKSAGAAEGDGGSQSLFPRNRMKQKTSIVR
jgi:hypothetical protein